MSHRKLLLRIEGLAENVADLRGELFVYEQQLAEAVHEAVSQGAATHHELAPRLGFNSRQALWKWVRRRVGE